jgi:hypothetical protein
MKGVLLSPMYGRFNQQQKKTHKLSFVKDHSGSFNSYTTLNFKPQSYIYEQKLDQSNCIFGFGCTATGMLNFGLVQKLQILTRFFNRCIISI